MRKIIDIHSHFNHAVNGDTITDELYRADIEFLQKEGQRLGVEVMGCCSFASVMQKENVVFENEYLSTIAQKNAHIYQWVVIEPTNKDTFKQAHELLKNKKCLGIKIITTYHGYDILEYADEIFSFANEHNATVLMHPDKILETAKLADKYPKMNLIVAHLGSLEHINAVKNAKHGNVYVDTSGIASSKNNIIEYAVSQIGSTKILFGSDTYSVAFQLGRIAFADITEEDKHNILYDNAKKLFKGIL